jgi:hypothetical protein
MGKRHKKAAIAARMFKALKGLAPIRVQCLRKLHHIKFKGGAIYAEAHTAADRDFDIAMTTLAGKRSPRCYRVLNAWKALYNYPVNPAVLREIPHRLQALKVRLIEAKRKWQREVLKFDPLNPPYTTARFGDFYRQEAIKRKFMEVLGRCTGLAASKKTINPVIFTIRRSDTHGVGVARPYVYTSYNKKDQVDLNFDGIHWYFEVYKRQRLVEVDGFPIVTIVRRCETTIEVVLLYRDLTLRAAVLHKPPPPPWWKLWGAPGDNKTWHIKELRADIASGPTWLYL